MIKRSFIFNTSREGSKAAIYCASRSGEQLFLQLKNENSVDILGFIDKNPLEAQLGANYCVFSPDDFPFYKTCDYYFIVHEHPSVREAIADTLRSFGVEDGQIVIPDEIIIADSGRFRMEDCPESLLDAITKLRSNCQNTYLDYYHLTMWLQGYYHKITDKNRFAEMLCRCFCDEVDIQKKIVYGWFLFYIQKMGCTEMKQFVDCAIKVALLDIDMGFFLASKIAHMELKQSSVLYKGLSEHRKTLWKIVTDEYAKRLPVLDSHHEKNSVCIMTHALGNSVAASSKVVREIATGLLNQNFRVIIIVILQNKEVAHDVFSIGDSFFYRMSHPYKQYNETALPKQIELDYLECGTVVEMFQQVVKEVNLYKPEIVIDMMDDVLPFSNIIAAKYPVLYYPIRNCSCGVSFYKTAARVAGLDEIPEDRKMKLPHRPFQMNDEIEVQYDRGAYLSIPDNGYIIITVGTRLESEISETFLRFMDALLSKHSHIYWVCVGDDKIKAKIDDIIKPQKQIRILSYEKNLAALYSICNAYLNPKRIGGGHSVALAVQMGLDVFALKFGDAVSYIDEQKIISGDEKDLFNYIDRAIINYKSNDKQKDSSGQGKRQNIDLDEWFKVFANQLRKMSNEARTRFSE